jgi:hypothetical protein
LPRLPRSPDRVRSIRTTAIRPGTGRRGSQGRVRGAAGVRRPVAGTGGCVGGSRAEINRKDFGITFNAPLETGGVLVSDKVVLEFDVSAIKGATE